MWTWHEEFYDHGMISTSFCDYLHEYPSDDIEVEIEKGQDDNENDRFNEML